MTHTLIIDDNPSNIKVLALLLDQVGASHSEISSPSFLDDALEDIPAVDVVFLDLEFPSEDGFEWLAKIKANPRLSTVRVIAYSVHISEVNLAKQAGFDGFLGKPLDFIEFPNYFQRIVNGESVWVV